MKTACQAKPRKTWKVYRKLFENDSERNRGKNKKSNFKRRA